MAKLTDYTSYADAQAHWAPDQAVGAVRRQPRAAQHRARVHRPPRRSATRGGHPRPRRRPRRDRSASPTSPRVVARFAHWLGRAGRAARAIASPSCSSRRCAFYVRVFGAMQAGAIAVPLFTLFGPDGIRLRVEDCKPTLLVTNAEKAAMARGIDGHCASSSPTTRFCDELDAYPATFEPQHARRRPRDLPVHLGHDARAAGGGQAHAPRARHADVRRALRHRHAARATTSSARRRRPGATACGTARSRRWRWA